MNKCRLQSVVPALKPFVADKFSPALLAIRFCQNLSSRAGNSFLHFTLVPRSQLPWILFLNNLNRVETRHGRRQTPMNATPLRLRAASKTETQNAAVRGVPTGARQRCDQGGGWDGLAGWSCSPTGNEREREYERTCGTPCSLRSRMGAAGRAHLTDWTTRPASVWCDLAPAPLQSGTCHWKTMICAAATGTD
jgi:hypothetical protein